MDAVRGKPRFEKRCLVNLHIQERWGRALRDFGLYTPARRELICEGEHASRRISDG